MPRLCLLILLALPALAATQEPPDRVRVRIGFVNGEERAFEDARFTGFIRTREDGAFLYYRLPHLRGEMPITLISRMKIGYRQGQPFALALQLRDGTSIEASSDRQHFLEIQGRSETGPVTIRHPDPLIAPPDASPGSPNRRDDLTIEYIEFLAD